MANLFEKLAKTYFNTEIEFPHLKEITLAQWLLESDRGRSELATKHFNFGGLKWRNEMVGFATEVEYEAHDGVDSYCRFESLEKFIKGYWRFMERSPYAGWRSRAESGETYIKFIGPIYAQDASYIQKILDLRGEAKKYLSKFGQVSNSERIGQPPQAWTDPGGVGLYVVKPGDTLFSIAEMNDTTVDQLLTLNPNIENPNQISAGQRIIIARVVGDEEIINSLEKEHPTGIEIPEVQLSAALGNYKIVSHNILGHITITGGFMEPHGHSWKGKLKAIFSDGKLKVLEPSDRNIGIDYFVANSQVRAWYGGTVTKAGWEGGYGLRIHVQLDFKFPYQGKHHQVYQAYAHNQEILVGRGQVVEQGQKIAIMGGSGKNQRQGVYDPHVDLSTYIFMGNEVVQVNPQLLDSA